MNKNDKSWTCLICNKVCSTLLAFSKHVHVHDLTPENYYKKFYLKDAEGICDCGNHTKFGNIRLGYRQYCSQKCSTSSAETKDKIKRSCITHYGVDNPSKDIGVRNKRKDTFIRNYGTDHPLKSQVVKDKIIRTCNDRYGTDNVLQVREVRNRIVQTTKQRYNVDNINQLDSIKLVKREKSLERYGTNCVLQSEVIKDQIRNTCLDKYGTTHQMKNNDFYNNYKKSLLIKFGVDNISKIPEVKEKLRLSAISTIQRKYKLKISPTTGFIENNCLLFLDTLFDGLMIRQYPICGYFIDAYLPDYNIAIEFDEEWHFKEWCQNRDHDRQKYIEDKANLQFFRIREMEWINSRDVIVKKFLNLLVLILIKGQLINEE